MDDRTLLEAAARAAGMWPLPYWEDGRGFGVPDREWWNPLTDDGDALRLAVKLRISLDHNHAGDQQRYVVAERPGCEGCFAPVCEIEDHIEDESLRPAATRRAIVRAAAAIGKEMT